MAEPTIYVTRKLRNGLRRLLETAGTVVMWEEESPVPRDVLLANVREADALLCMGDDAIDLAVIAAAPQLRVICTMTAGYDHIDLTAAKAAGITVCHTPGTADNAVADLTLTLVLACARGLPAADRFVRERRWAYWSPYLFLGTDMSGSTLGIIGLGHIGLQVAHRALGFGMRVLYHDIRRNEDAEQRMAVQYGGLDNVLREADFVTLHLPLLPATRGLIDERRLRLMKPTAFLINMARGPIVDQEALVRALREGWIAGAGLDVYNVEPIPGDNPLLELPNVVLTPHIGANTRQAMHAMMRMAVEQVIQVLRGQPPAHRVPLPEETHRAA